jgi:hypothetical protein
MPKLMPQMTPTLMPPPQAMMRRATPRMLAMRQMATNHSIGGIKL